MNYRKGMSQTLALIVAASVLMMTALTVIMMTQGGLQDVFGGSNRQSCVSTVKNTCRYTSGSVPTPESCERAGMTGQSVNYENNAGNTLTAQIGDSNVQCGG